MTKKTWLLTVFIITATLLSSHVFAAGFDLGVFIGIVAYNLSDINYTRPIQINGSNVTVSIGLTYYGSGLAFLSYPAGYNDAWNYTIYEDGTPIATYSNGSRLNWTANGSRSPRLQFKLSPPFYYINQSYSNGLIYVEDFIVAQNNSYLNVTYNKTFSPTYRYWVVYHYNGTIWYDKTREYNTVSNFTDGWISFSEFNVTEYVNETFVVYGSNACLESWDCGSWSSCNSGLRTRVCVDFNNCGTDVFKPIISMECEESPSGGGGGSTRYYTDEPINVTSIIYVNVSENKTLKTTILFFNETPNKIIASYYVTDDSELIDIYLTQVGEPAILPEREAYEYWTLDPTKDVEQSTIYFKVAKNWTDEYSVDKDTIRLEYFRDGEWLYVVSEYQIFDKDYFYYRAKPLDFLPTLISITGVSEFAFEKNVTVEPPLLNITNQTEITPPVIEKPTVVYKWKFPWWILLIALLAVVASILITREFTKRHGDVDLSGSQSQNGSAVSISSGSSGGKQIGAYGSVGKSPGGAIAGSGATGVTSAHARGSGFFHREPESFTEVGSADKKTLVHKAAVEEGFTKVQVKEVLASEGVDNRLLRKVMGRLKTRGITSGKGSGALRFDERQFLQNYVSDSLKKGYTKEQIKAALQYAGYGVSDIDMALEGKFKIKPKTAASRQENAKHTHKSDHDNQKKSHHRKKSQN